MLLNTSFDSFKNQRPANQRLNNKTKEESKNTLFELLIFLIQYSPITKRFEIVSAIIQSIQLISYAFESKFEDCWKSTFLFPLFNKIFIYFKLTPFFKHHIHLYLVAFYFTVVVISITTLFIVILLIQKSKGPIKYIQLAESVSILSAVITSVLFIPISETLVSIFDCFFNNTAVLGPYNQNRNIIHIIIGSIALIIFLLMSFIAINSIYDLKYKGSPFSTKKTLRNDNILFFNKCLIILFNCFLTNCNASIFLLAIVCSFSIYQTYIYFTVRCFHSFLIQKAYRISSILITWTYLILFLNKIAINCDIIGSVTTFWVIGGCLIIIGNIFIKRSVNITLLMKDHLKISTADVLIEQVEEIIDLLYSKSNQRRSRIMLFGYINSYNLRCIDHKHNPLENYFCALNETKNINFFIFHLNDLLKYGLAKYPTSIRLRIYYSLFIYENLFKREQALKELEYARRSNSLSFSEKFFVYRLKKEINIQLYPQLGDSISLQLNNKESSITYKSLLSEFKHLISKLTSQYTEFWTILYNSDSNDRHHNELSKLNSIGIKIKKDFDSIHETYENLIQLKPNDQDIIFDYWYFVTNILNDKEKSVQLVNQLKDIVNLSQAINEDNLSHIDLKKMHVNDDYPFIIFSALPKSLGIITHISMQLCSLFGYKKEELLGKPIETLLPQIYTQAHQRYLMSIVNYYKNKLYDNYSLFQNFKIEFKEQLTYVANKSKYLIPVISKATFFPNDDGNEYFYMKLAQDNSISSIAYKHHICYILTDINLVIQNFTANCVNMLGLNSAYICSSKVITDNIRQFHEDYLKTMLENERKGFNNGYSSIDLKRKLIHAKYSFPTPITWMNLDKTGVNNDDQSIRNSNHQIEESSNYMLSSNKSKKFQSYENYMLTVHDYGHIGENQGFIFQFEPISNYNIRQSSVSNYMPTSSKPLLHSMTLKDDKKKKSLHNNSHNTAEFNQLRVGSTGFSSNNPVKILKNYIPEVTLQFSLNPTTQSFYQSIQVNKEEFLDQIKYQVDAKRYHNTSQNNNNNNQGLSLNDSSNTSEDSSSLYSSSNNYSQASKDILFNNSLMNHNNNNGENKDDIDHNYYRVNTSNIKLYLYDFKKRVLNEQFNCNKISEVQLRLSKSTSPLIENQLLKLPLQSSKVIITLSQTSDNYKSEGQLNSYSSLNLQLSEATVSSRTEKVKQEIKKALSKDSIQSTVIALYILSIISFILAISKEVIFLMHYIIMIDNITDHILLIRDSFRLHRNMILTIFCIRELTLVNTNNYTIPQAINKEIYIAKFYGLLNNYFKENDVIIKNMTTTNIQFPIEMSEELNAISSSNCLINNTNNYNLNCYNNTFSSSVNAFNNALHNILTSDLKDLIPTNDNVFFFMYNVMNSIWLGVDKFNEFCNALFSDMSNAIIWKLSVIFIGCELMLLVIYLIARKGLVDASYQNDSYLTIFFAIEKRDIAFLLKKCEKFSNHFQNNKIKDKYFKKEMHKDDEDNDSKSVKDNYLNNDKGNNDFSNHIKETKFTNNILKSKTIVQPNKNNKPKKGTIECNCVGLFLFGHVFVILGALGVLIFDSFLLAQMLNFKKQIHLSIDIYESQVRLQRQSLLLFTLIRESVFESNAYFKNDLLQTYIKQEIANIFNEIQKERQKIKEIIQYLSDKIYTFYFSINFKSLCMTTKDQSKCLDYTNKAADYGLENLVTFFLEEIRSLYYSRTNIDIMYKNMNFTYNYTLYGTDEYSAYFPTNPHLNKLYFKISPMEMIFNSFTHEKLVYMYWSLINPSYNELVAYLGGEIENQCLSQRQYYILAFGIMIGIILLLVFAIWFPFVNSLSSNIYKTKNMLSIVSMEILASLKSINGLLGINQDINLYEKNIN